MNLASSLDDPLEAPGPEEHREIDRGTRRFVVEHKLLAELRKARGLTQQEVAERMVVGQSAISKIEGQDDMLIRTLDRYVGALGGILEVTARFPDAVIALHRFTGPRIGEKAAAQLERT